MISCMPAFGPRHLNMTSRFSMSIFLHISCQLARIMTEELVSKVKGKKVGRPSKSGKTVPSSPASLPPQVPDVDAGSSTPPAEALVPTEPKPPKKPFWDVGKDTKQYETTMKILAMRTAGIEDKTIADTLGISPQTVWNYCYIAGKQGWADDFANAKDQIEFRIMPKVVRELERGLDDTQRHVTSGMTVGQQMALQIAAGTVFKRFEQAATEHQISNIVAIRIEHVGGGIVDVREGNTGGVPAYQDGETVDGILAE